MSTTGISLVSRSSGCTTEIPLVVCMCARVHTYVGEREIYTIPIANSPLPENYSLSQSMNRWLHNCGRGFFFVRSRPPPLLQYYYFMDQ